QFSDKQILMIRHKINQFSDKQILKIQHPMSIVLSTGFWRH
ncbi:unnamed protein product, partial [Rotaria magnacalcarata]